MIIAYRRFERTTKFIFNCIDQFSREKYVNLLAFEGGIIGCPQNSVRNYQYALNNNKNSAVLIDHNTERN